MKFSSNEKPVITPNPEGMYLVKPLSIGAVIKQIVFEKRIPRSELAARLKMKQRSVYRIFNLKHPKILHLLRLSEAIDENLLLQYHPNVKPIANPLEAENTQLKSEIAQLRQQLIDYHKTSEENKLLKSQLDVLKEMIKGKL
jgi:cell division protein FtsB